MSSMTNLVGSFQSLNAASGTGVGLITGVEASQGTYGFQISFSGGTPTTTISLDGSIDGLNWVSLVTSSGAGIVWISNKPVAFLRANITAYAGSGNVNAFITASRP
jgi:hypothetical protein